MAKQQINEKQIKGDDWTSVSLDSGFTGTVQVKKVGNMVYIQGSVTRTAGAFPTGYTQVATIPSGFRPMLQMRMPASAYQSTSNLIMNILVDAAGNLQVFGQSSARSDVIYLSHSWLVA